MNKSEIGAYLASLQQHVVNAVKHTYPGYGVSQAELFDVYSAGCLHALETGYTEAQELRDALFDGAYKSIHGLMKSRTQFLEHVVRGKPHEAVIDFRMFHPKFYNNLTALQRKVYILRQKCTKTAQIATQVGISQSHVCVELYCLRRRYYRWMRRRALFRKSYLRHLDPHMREIFVRSYIDGYSSRDIARDIGKTQNYVNSILSTGKRKLIDKGKMVSYNKRLIYNF